MLKEDCRILVTGADGFIGSHLVELLVANGFNVRALAQYNSFGTWGWLDSVSCKGEIEIISGDLRDPFFCKALCREVDVVCHLAALIGIPYSYKVPQSYVETNILGTLNICQAALENGVKRVIHTSTSEVYGTAQYVPINESHPLQPQSPYSASKIGADAMAMSYYHSFDLPVTVLRPFNTYGPRQSARAVIPTIISQLEKHVHTLKLGTVTTTRDFNYVADTVAAYLATIQSDQSIGKTINIGSNYEVSISDVVSMIADIMAVDVNIQTDVNRVRPKDSEVERLWADNQLALELLGWKPNYAGLKGLRNGLAETITWFMHGDNLSKYKPEVYNV